jgi:XRE family transcriptional regulator, regulator of sulfur utilization
VPGSPRELLQSESVTDRLSQTLAVRLHEERRRRRLSLRKLAEVSGLSPTTIHQIETGRGSPSLATLQTLASTLGVPLASLFERGPTPPDPVVMLPARKRARVRTPGGSLERLATGLPGQRLRGLLLTLAPGGDTGEEPMTHPGHELVFGLTGRCLYVVAGKEYRVGPGDSLLLDSRQPHRGRNPGRRDARLLLVLYAPDEEPAWMGSHTRG